jgi:FG-GAP-like repeat/Bacterial Ig-like domain
MKWFRKWKQTRPATSQGKNRSPARSRPRLLLEKLEDRTVPSVILLNGSGNDTLTVNATGNNSGSYTLNNNAPVPFAGVTSFTFNDTGTSTFTINNPSGGLFAPSSGIVYNGGGFGNLLDLGGSATTGSFAPNSNTPANSGTLTEVGSTVTQTITFTGLAPATDTVSSPTFTISGSAGPDTVSIVDGPLVGGAQTTTVSEGHTPPNFESVTFANKTAVTFNDGDGGNTITVNLPTQPTGLATLNVNSGNTPDEINVLATPSGVTTNTDTETGVPDSTVIGGTLAAFNTGTGTLANINGTVNVDDSGSVGEIYIDDSGDTTGQTYTQNALANVPTFGGSGFQFSSTVTTADINYTLDETSVQVAGGSGNDTFDVNATSSAAFSSGTGTGPNTFFGNAGNDVFNIAGDNLAGDNDFQGNAGNDTFNLNINTDLGAASGALNSLTIEGGAPSGATGGTGGGPGGINRDALNINDLSGTARALNFQYDNPTVTTAPSGNLLISGFAVNINVLTMETVIASNSSAVDSATVTGTEGDDQFTVAPISETSAVVFNGTASAGGGWGNFPGQGSFFSTLPGVAGGSNGPDLFIQSLATTGTDPNGGPITAQLKIVSNAANNGAQLFVDAPSSTSALIDPAEQAAGTNPFGFGPGVLIPSVPDAGATGSYNLIDVNNANAPASFGAAGDYNSTPNGVAIDNSIIGQLVTVVMSNPAGFAPQNLTTPMTNAPGLIVNSGDQAGFKPATGIADNISAVISATYFIRVNGQNPPPGSFTPDGTPEGDQLNVIFIGDINVWSDTVPNVTLQDSTIPNSGITFSSIERTNFTPGTGVVNVIGNDNDPNVTQNDVFVILGEALPSVNSSTPPVATNDFSLQIGGDKNTAGSGPAFYGPLSAKIYFTGVHQINAYGGAVFNGTTNDFAHPDGFPGSSVTTPTSTVGDVLDITPYANNTPAGWGITTYWYEGAPAGINDGDLLTFNAAPGVSNAISVLPSASMYGTVADINGATNTPINVVNYLLNTNIIVNGQTGGNMGNTDTLTLDGTNPDTGVNANVSAPPPSGNDDFNADFTAAGTPLAPMVTVTDLNPSAVAFTPLYNLQTFTGFNTLNVNMLGGADLFNLVAGRVGGGLTVNVDGGPPSGTAGPVPVDTIQVDAPMGGGINEFAVSPGASNYSGQINVTNSANGAIGLINFKNTEDIDLIGGGPTAVDFVTLAGTQGNDNFQLTGTSAGAGFMQLSSGPEVNFSNMAPTIGSPGLTEIFLIGNGGNDSYTITQVAGWDIGDVVVEGSGSDTVTLLGTTDGDAYTFIPFDTNAGEVLDNDGMTTTEYDVSGVRDLTLNGQTTNANTLTVDVAAGESSFITPGQDSGSGNFTVNTGTPTTPGINLLPVNYLHIATVTPTTGSVADIIVAAGDSVNVSAAGIVTVTDASGIILNTLDFAGDPNIQLDIDALAGHVAVTINQNTTGGSLFGGGIQVKGGNSSTNGDSVTVVSSTAGNTTAYDFLLNMLTGIVTGPISLFGIASLVMDGTSAGAFVLTNYGAATTLTQVTINATGSSSLTVNGASGNDSFTYSPTGANAGTVSLAGAPPVVNFSGVGGAFTLDGGTGGTKQITVNGTAGNDTIAVVRAAPNTTVTVDALKAVTVVNADTQALIIATGTGTDTVNVSGTAGPASLTVNGGNQPALDTLTVANTTAGTTTVVPGTTPDAGTVQTPNGNVGFTGMRSVSLTGAAATDTLVANGTNASDAIALQFLGGANRFWVNSQAVVSFASFGTVTLNGGFGNDSYSVSPVGLVGVTTINVTGQATPNSDTLVVNGAATVSTIGYAPTGRAAGTVSVTTAAPVGYTNIQALTINGQGGADTLTVTTPVGVNKDTYTPGATADSGMVQVNSFTPLTFQNLSVAGLGTGGSLAFAHTGGTRADTLTVTGTTGNDTFGVAATTGTVTLNAQIPITTAGVANLVLNALTGLDVFNLAGPLPYTTTTLNADATANLTGATGPVTVNIADNTPGSPNPNTTITGYGGTVVLVGIDIANLNTNGNTLTVNGYSGPNTFTYTPTGPSAGTFTDPAVSTPGITTAVGVNTVFNFSNVGGAFTINGGANLGDQVIVQGPNTPSFVVVNSAARTVTVQNAVGTTLQPVTLGASVEQVTVNGNLGNESTFLVIPAPATLTGPGGSGTIIPLNLLVNIVGGPANNDALVIASSAAGAALPNNDFVVDLLSLTPGTGTIRVFPSPIATPDPDITYSNIGTVAPLVTPNGTDPNLLNMGPDNLEPNNSLANASFLGTVGSATPLNEPHLALFPNALEYKFVPADQDWFRVEAQATGTLDFQVFFQTYAGLPANGVLDMNVTDVNGNVITGFGTDYGGPNDDRRIPVVAGQTYYVEILGANPNVVNGFGMSIINTPAPTPFDLELSRSVPNGESGTAAGAPDTGDLPPNAAADDTGRSQFDNVTDINTPTIYIRLNDGNLLNDLPGNGTPSTGLPFPAVPIPFQTTVTPGYRVAIFDGSDSQNPVGFATQVAGFPGLYQFTFTTPLADGVHNINAAVQMIDPTNVATGGELTGLGTVSTTALQLTIDTVPPPVEFGDAQTAFNGLVSQNDSGSAALPPTLNDQITNVTNPTFWGLAEANSVVMLYADIDGSGVVDATSVLLGQAQAIPIDGTNAFPNGQWTITSLVNLNNPVFFPLDGVRNLLVVAQDLAGNTSTPNATSKESIFVQTQAPTVTGVSISNAPGFNLLASKANVLGNGTQLSPTPAVNGLTLTFQSLPNRSAQFPTDVALLAQAIIVPGTLTNPAAGVFVGTPVPGTFILTGNNVGNVPITMIVITENPVTPGLPATATVQLFFPSQFTPLPDDEYTLKVTGNVVDFAGNPLLGGLFTATFLVNSHPHIGTWWSGDAYVDVNGDGVFDPQGQVNNDLVFSFGLDSDYLFSGNFAPQNGIPDTTFDKIGAYGKVNGSYRFLLDFTGAGATPAPGTPGYIIPTWQINGIPIAGHFDAALPNSEQIGVFDGHGNWYLNTSGSDILGSPGDTVISDGLTGYPVVGDFDGNGSVDLATYQPSTETWTFDLNPLGGGPHVITSLHWGFPGVGARPVAADLNLDGVTDIGLMVPGSEGATPEVTDDWYFLVSQGTPVAGTINTLNHPFSPAPLGSDRFFEYGDSQALPLVGTFDPPSALTNPITPAVTGPTANWWAGISGGNAMDTVSESMLNTALGWQNVMAVDLNGDGRTDLVGMTNTGQWWVALSIGAGFDTQLWTTWAPGAGWTNLHTGVFTANGKQDILGMTSNGQWWLGINEGSGFVNELWGQWNPGAIWTDVVVGDFNGDGLADIAGLTAGGQWWLGMNNGTQFVNHLGTTWAASAGWQDIEVGDFTGDGKADILARTSYGQWWLAISNGQTFANVLYGAWYEAAGWQDVMVGDFNHDGRLDVLGMTNGGQWWLAENTGTGFVNKLWAQWSWSAGWQNVMSGDFNGDGWTDVVGQTASGQWWLAVGTASGFITVPWGQWSSAVHWQNLVAGDFNGDGKIDLIGQAT